MIASLYPEGPSAPRLVVLRGGRLVLSEALPAMAEETMNALKRLGGQ